jgi:hypothetical protein
MPSELTANPDNNRSTSPLSHEGHAGAAELWSINSSNSLAHWLHRYS